MNKINIDNLFNNTGKEEQYRPLDVYSLYNPQKNLEDKEINFSVDRLINHRKEKKNRVIDEYKKIFRMCLKKVDVANKLNTYDIVYEIPIAIYRCNEYRPKDCLNFIEERLKKLFLDTCVISDYSVFISWKNIEKNKGEIEKNKGE
jgi:hypothetical protein